MKRNAPFSLLTILPIAMLCLSGCLNLEPKPDPTQFYVLGTNSAITKNSAASPVPQVIRIEVPKYLQRNEIATRKSDHEISYMSFSRWAEPLEAGFLRVFKNELAKYNYGEDGHQLTIELLRFEANEQAVLLEARIPDYGGYSVEVPLEQTTKPEAIVSAMTRAVQEFAGKVAADLSP